MLVHYIILVRGHFVKKSDLRTYDIYLKSVGKSLPEMISKLNSNLCDFSKWLKRNKLKLNIEKTKYMIISHKMIDGEDAIMMDGSKIERVKEFFYL